MKISLKNRDIPRNKMGDPAFRFLDAERMTGDELNTEGNTPTVLDVFTPEECVELVNRCVYQLEYQARSHAKRNASQALLERPIKEAFRELYPGESYAKATPHQIRECLRKIQG